MIREELDMIAFGDAEPEALGLDSRIDRLADWHGDAHEAVTEAIAIYREAARMISEFKGYQAKAKDALGGIIAETGQTDWTTDAGRAQVTSPGVRTSYDTKALDALCASDDNIARLLSPHRKVTEVAGNLTIRAK